jgi:hypothetical protein
MIFPRCKNGQAYYNAGVVIVNYKVVGLAWHLKMQKNISNFFMRLELSLRIKMCFFLYVPLYKKVLKVISTVAIQTRMCLLDRYIPSVTYITHIFCSNVHVCTYMEQNFLNRVKYKFRIDKLGL